VPKPARRSIKRQVHRSENFGAYKGDFLEVEPDKGSATWTCRSALVSVAASLIPFLEHDTASRLMVRTCNARACPLIQEEAPLVAPGWRARWPAIPAPSIVSEGRASRLGHRQLHHCHFGRAKSPRQKEAQARSEEGIYVTSCASTCVRMRHLHEPKAPREEGPAGQQGQVICDGPCHRSG